MLAAEAVTLVEASATLVAASVTVAVAQVLAEVVIVVNLVTGVVESMELVVIDRQDQHQWDCSHHVVCAQLQVAVCLMEVRL